MLMAPQHVKAYLRRGKHDAADAEATCEAMSRPRTRFVPVKSVEQQAGQMLFGVREQLVRRRTQLSNAIRGHAAEFGLVAAKGLAHVEPLLGSSCRRRCACRRWQRSCSRCSARNSALSARGSRALEKKLVVHYRQDETAQRLAAMPGVGPIGATLLGIKVTDAGAFRSGRDFAAWLGLTPKNHSTAGKNRLGVITRAGDEMLRQVLVVGATAHIQQVRRGRIKASPWLARLIARKPPKLAAVALANKTARIAWKMMVTGEPYRCDQSGSLAPASPPSRPLRAACGGGLRPALTAAQPGAVMPG